jgi:hypothetical protein
VASLPVQQPSSPLIPLIPKKFARLPYFNSWKGPPVLEDRKLAGEHFGDNAKLPAVNKQSPVPRILPISRAKEIHVDLIAEHEKIKEMQLIPPAAQARIKKSDRVRTEEPSTDVLTKLNYSITKNKPSSNNSRLL